MAPNQAPNEARVEAVDGEIVFEDDYITLRLLDFDSASCLARLAIDEFHSNVGFYNIWISFASGAEICVEHDGASRRRNLRPIVQSDRPDDVLERIAVMRISDSAIPA
ncbi:MAG: hypothetical protein ABSD20_03610 [Terriglobales bacterium]